MKHVAILAGFAALMITPALAQDCADGFRLFDHEFLDGDAVCIPANPQRVALVMNQIVPAYLLGVKSVVHNGYFDTLLVQYPNALGGEKLIAEHNVNWFWESSPEIVLQAEPDLIVSGSGQELNGQVSSIAPLIAIDYAKSPTWRDTQDFVAAALNLEDKAAELTAELDARIARLKADLGEQERTFAIVRAKEGSDVEVFYDTNTAASILKQAGMVIGPNILSPEDAPEGGNAALYPLSGERIAEQLEVDHLFFMPSFSGSEASYMTDLDNDPIWQRLDVVKDKRVVVTSGSGRHFVQGDVAFSHLVIDDVYRGVLGLDPAEVNPNPYADWLAR